MRDALAPCGERAINPAVVLSSKSAGMEYIALARRDLT
jgi:hypothetical protein